MKKWKSYLMWLVLSLTLIFAAFTCQSWGLYDLLKACVFDSNTFDSGCTFN